MAYALALKSLKVPQLAENSVGKIYLTITLLYVTIDVPIT